MESKMCLSSSSFLLDGNAAEAPGVSQLHRVSGTRGLSGPHPAGDALMGLTVELCSHSAVEDSVIASVLCQKTQANCKEIYR